jgi:hypothetical protein
MRSRYALRMNMTPEEQARFMGKVAETPTGCWLWQGPLDRDGYGSFFFRRRNRRAHRVGYFLQHGPISAGLLINHTCRNRHCVNPQHLEAVDARTSALKDTSSPAYVNSQKTHCPRGHHYDRQYGKQRYCSVCQNEKAKRLRAKWKAEETEKIV